MITKKQVPVVNALQFALESLQNSWSLFIISAVLYIPLVCLIATLTWRSFDLTDLLLDVITGTTSTYDFSALIVPFSIWSACVLLKCYISLIIIQLTLQLYDNNKAVKLNCLPSLKTFIKYVIAVMAIGLLVTLPWFLVVPGMIMLTKYFFVSVASADDSTSLKQAFKRSSRATFGVRWTLFGYTLMVGVLILLSLQFFSSYFFVFVNAVLQLILTLASVYVYRSLLDQQNEIDRKEKNLESKENFSGNEQ
ncbi:hypothetical protein H0X48_06545 [Candidatus Dependentiae bacterium]|nr:hypothetical protein [Candidatus Dependentiae bacterium]